MTMQEKENLELINLFSKKLTGREIYFSRLSLGIKNAEFAKFCQMSPTTLHKIEREVAVHPERYPITYSDFGKCIQSASPSWYAEGAFKSACKGFREQYPDNNKFISFGAIEDKREKAVAKYRQYLAVRQATAKDEPLNESEQPTIDGGVLLREQASSPCEDLLEIEALINGKDTEEWTPEPNDKPLCTVIKSSLKGKSAVFKDIKETTVENIIDQANSINFDKPQLDKTRKKVKTAHYGDAPHPETVVKYLNNINYRLDCMQNNINDAWDTLCDVKKEVQSLNTVSDTIHDDIRRVMGKTETISQKMLDDVLKININDNWLAIMFNRTLPIVSLILLCIIIFILSYNMFI